MDIINTPQENDSGFSKLDDDILSIIFTMLFVSSDFRKCHKIISEINKQFYRIVLNIIPILSQINFYNTNFIKYKKTKKLTKFLKKTKNITTLELKGINIKMHVFSELVSFLENNTTLTTFCFKNSSVIFGKNCTEEWFTTYHTFLDFLETTTLVELNVSHIEIGNTQYEIDTVGGIVYAIADYLQDDYYDNILVTLRTLKLNSNRLSCDGVKLLARCLKINKTLITLILNNNNIYLKGAELIAETLEINKTLTKLSLAGNSIGSDGAIRIMQALKHNSTLKILILSNNYIFLREIDAITETLKINKTLTKLNLAGNGMNYMGAIAIAEALKINNTLTTLNLSYSHLGFNGAIAIAEAVKINTTLTLLDFRCCNIGEDGAKAIAEALEINTTIQIIT